MLSKEFRKRIDNITEIEELEKEIETMSRIMNETDNITQVAA